MPFLNGTLAHKMSFLDMYCGITILLKYKLLFSIFLFICCRFGVNTIHVSLTSLKIADNFVSE